MGGAIMGVPQIACQAGVLRYCSTERKEKQTHTHISEKTEIQRQKGGTREKIHICSNKYSSILFLRPTHSNSMAHNVDKEVKKRKKRNII
jgi:hypothetical protein